MKTPTLFPDPSTEAERDRELVKAGALIVAELDRRQRARLLANGKGEPRSPSKDAAPSVPHTSANP